MQLINYLPSKSDSCETKALFPIVGQSRVTVPSGSGSTPTDLFTALVTGDVPYHAGQVRNDSCTDLQLTLSYVGGSDCDSCTVDTLSTQVINVVVPKGAVFPLPSGLISSATFTTGSWDGVTFTASDVAVDSVIEWYSNYQPCCDSTIVLP